MEKMTQAEIKRTAVNMIESSIRQVIDCIEKDIDHRYASAILLGYLNMAYATEILTEEEFEKYSNDRIALEDSI